MYNGQQFPHLVQFESNRRSDHNSVELFTRHVIVEAKYRRMWLVFWIDELLETPRFTFFCC